jgi:hypothetical protein
MKAKLHDNLEVEVGDVVDATFDDYGTAKGEVIDITEKEVLVKWYRLDWNTHKVGTIHTYPHQWDRAWKLNESSKVERLLKEYEE